MVQTKKNHWEPPAEDPTNPYDSRVAGALGKWVGETPAEDRLKFHKELVNKLSWVLGSAYKARYSGKRSPVIEYAQLIAKAVLRDHGYQI